MSDDVFQFWADRYPLLDPMRELGLDEFQQMYVPPPDGPVPRIVGLLKTWRLHAKRKGALAGAPHKFLFCGARGSGKSTQLRYLARELGGQFEVLLLDIAPALPARTGTLHIVSLIGFALLARLKQWENQAGDAARLARGATGEQPFLDALTRIANAVPAPELLDAVSALMVSMGAPGVVPAALVPAAKMGFTALKERIGPAKVLGLGRLGERISGETREEALELVNRVSRLADDLEALSERPVLVLVDGLDRFRDAASTLEALADVDLLRDLGCAVVFTGPTNLRHSPAIAGLGQDLRLDLVFNMPVVERDGSPKESGVRCLEAVLEKRAGSKEYGELFEPRAVQEAARLSSGMPRDFLRILLDASTVAAQDERIRVRLADIQVATRTMRLQLQQPITSQDIRLLEEVRVTGRTTGREREEDLLFLNYIACYPDGDTWFRPNELLADWVREQALLLGAREDLRSG